MEGVATRLNPTHVLAGTWTEMEAAVQNLHTDCETDQIGGVRRAWQQRRDGELPTTEEFTVAAPYIGREKCPWPCNTTHALGH
jgi:hypothetical protein